jgi:hypothetical protein
LRDFDPILVLADVQPNPLSRRSANSAAMRLRHADADSIFNPARIFGDAAAAKFFHTGEMPPRP